MIGFLAKSLSEGPIEIGQLVVHPDFVIHHAEDQRDDCSAEVFRTAEAALELARWDEAGTFRPLKTAPNLRRGWRLELDSLTDVRLAIDYFYPSALGHAVARLEGRFQATSLREVLARQTGMYAVTKKATEEELRGCVEETCSRGRCLNRIQWEIQAGTPSPYTSPAPESERIPLLCSAACPLLVGAIRARVKARLATGSAAAEP